MDEPRFRVRPVGHVASTLARREHAPMQGAEGAPDAWIVFEDDVAIRKGFSGSCRN